MTRKEAIELQNKCDKMLSNFTHCDCMVSMTLSGLLKVNIDSNLIAFGITNDHKPYPDYISYEGDYYSMEGIITDIKHCISENFYDFNQLMWSYRHIDELED